MHSHVEDSEHYHKEHEALKKIVSYSKEMDMEDIVEYSSELDKYHELFDFYEEVRKKNLISF